MLLPKIIHSRTKLFLEILAVPAPSALDVLFNTFDWHIVLQLVDISLGHH